MFCLAIEWYDTTALGDNIGLAVSRVPLKGLVLESTPLHLVYYPFYLPLNVRIPHSCHLTNTRPPSCPSHPFAGPLTHILYPARVKYSCVSRGLLTRCQSKNSRGGRSVPTRTLEMFFAISWARERWFIISIVGGGWLMRCDARASWG